MDSLLNLMDRECVLYGLGQLLHSEWKIRGHLPGENFLENHQFLQQFIRQFYSLKHFKVLVDNDKHITRRMVQNWCLFDKLKPRPFRNVNDAVN